jgi:DNA-binding PadR family transcriptional regulator
LSPLSWCCAPKLQRTATALEERLGDLGLALPTGKVYRTLRQLEKAGLVVSTWQTASDPSTARRVYGVTAAGQRQLHSSLLDAEAFVKVIDRLLER